MKREAHCSLYPPQANSGVRRDNGGIACREFAFQIDRKQGKISKNKLSRVGFNSALNLCLHEPHSLITLIVDGT